MAVQPFCKATVGRRQLPARWHSGRAAAHRTGPPRRSGVSIALWAPALAHRRHSSGVGPVSQQQSSQISPSAQRARRQGGPVRLRRRQRDLARVATTGPRQRRRSAKPGPQLHRARSGRCGPFRTFDLAFTSAPASSSSSAIDRCPLFAASTSGVWPNCEGWPRAHGASGEVARLAVARHSGKCPTALCATASASAPAVCDLWGRSLTISLASMSAPWLSSSLATSRWPQADARSSADL